MRLQAPQDWAAGQVAGLPPRWQKRLLASWQKAARPRRESYVHGGVRHWYEVAEGGACNADLRATVVRFNKLRITLGASDDEICRRAQELAVQCMDVARIQTDVMAVRFGMEKFCIDVGVTPPGVVVTDTKDRRAFVRVSERRVKTRSAILRMTCPEWWRKQLRKLHARAVEGAAIEFGYVNKAADCYVSNESLERRAQQNRRNARMMESTTLRNELDQEFTLAELAARGVANKAIRRGELMTRIAGFDVIARDCRHVGMFLTWTCPSRMHKFASIGGGRVVENGKFDGTRPNEAQRYLSKCWARARAKMARLNIAVYGFRICEPHHDGCPHWHLLLFTERQNAGAMVRIMREYALKDSPGEAGARKHRFTSKRINWRKGGAASYLMKYVSKNIDGYGFEADLFGNPAIEASQRVEAWAATWRIRQFQQIGGAPVGVWRELRRVKELPENAPEHLRRAHVAVNRIEGAGENGEAKAADWAEYCRCQGGVFVGRDAAITLEKEATGELGRYGEAVPPSPVGVSALGAALAVVSGIAQVAGEVGRVVVRSVRHVWEVVKSSAKSADGWSRLVFTRAREVFSPDSSEVNGWPDCGLAAVFSPPWTRVNNCTQFFEKIGPPCGGLAGA